MKGNLSTGVRRAPMEVNKQFTDQGQRENDATKMDVEKHPFDWWDLLLIMMPITAVVLTMFWEAE